MDDYRVIILDRSLQRLEQILDYIANDQQAPLAAENWLKKVLDKIRSLRRFPHRCPYAPENSTRDYDIRMMIVDRYLLLFNIDETNNVVRILTIRHGSQLEKSGDLPEEI